MNCIVGALVMGMESRMSIRPQSLVLHQRVFLKAKEVSFFLKCIPLMQCESVFSKLHVSRPIRINVTQAERCIRDSEA